MPGAEEPSRPRPREAPGAGDDPIAGAEVPDVARAGLQVLFCGINPGRYSAAVGHHFARPGNRFWRALCDSGFTDRTLAPIEDSALPSYGLGVTNLVRRPTGSASELTATELRDGASTLREKVRSLAPEFVAVLGIGAYRTAFGRPRAVVGLQAEDLAGVRIWVLPNPSGLNARYQRHELARAFTELRRETRSARRARRGPG
jgi:double-stranded uracil-DNA glycosylase